jgi:KipI family sensor histidine kinase inhibitor
VSVRFVPAGDLAVAMELDAPIDAAMGERLRALEALAAAEIPGITETVPSFRALLVYYDPLRIGYEALCERLRTLLPRAERAPAPPGRRVELPCCYRDPALGFELAAAAERLALSVDALIRLQTSVEYRVHFIGFAPGQPYLTGLPARLEIPRLDTPRACTPAGSIGIGGTQCCIYSVESPGGFWVLGRTPVSIYDPRAAEPVLLRPGDRLRFREIDRAEYERIAASVAAGTFRVAIA